MLYPIYLEQKIQENSQNDVIITEVNGVANVVTFTSTAPSILGKFYEEPRHNDREKEQLHIIEKAATLIKSEIKSINTNKAAHLTSEEIESLEQNVSYIPHGLQPFLRKIFAERNPEKTSASIAQAILQAACVLIAPLQMGLGAQVNHHFASKFLIESVNSHGISPSYNEVTRFEKCAADFLGKNISLACGTVL